MREVDAARIQASALAEQREQQLGVLRDQAKKAAYDAVEEENLGLRHLSEHDQLLHRLDAIQTSEIWALAKPIFEASNGWSNRLTKPALKGARAVRDLASLQPRERRRKRNAYELVLKSGLFDWKWYVEQHPQVIVRGNNPLWYWLETGWKRGDDPSPDVRISWYIEQHPDIAASGENPLLHHLREARCAGARTGLLARSRLFRARALARWRRGRRRGADTGHGGQ